MEDRWIIVRNWDKFQHYSNRNPAWIKVYTSLNSEDEWLDLSVSDRGVLVSIWLEYARSKGQLRTLTLGKKLGLSPHYAHLYRHLERLNHAGFIQLVASKPLALARSREEEVEKKKKEPIAFARKKPVDNPEPQRANVLPADPVIAIRTMIQNGVITDIVDLEAELAGAFLDGTTAAEQLRASLSEHQL